MRDVLGIPARSKLPSSLRSETVVLLLGRASVPSCSHWSTTVA